MTNPTATETERTNENAVIASIIAGAPQPMLRITSSPPQPDPLDRLAAALEAQNHILARLADAVEDIAAVALGAEAGLRKLISQLDGLGSFSVWGEDDAGDPLEIPL